MPSTGRHVGRSGHYGPSGRTAAPTHRRTLTHSRLRADSRANKCGTAQGEWRNTCGHYLSHLCVPSFGHLWPRGRSAERATGTVGEVEGVRACMHMRHPQRVYRNRLAGELLARLRAAAEKTAGLVMTEVLSLVAKCGPPAPLDAPRWTFSHTACYPLCMPMLLHCAVPRVVLTL